MNAEFRRAHDRFEETLLRFCGPIYIVPTRSSPPSQIISNGTFGLIDTGKCKLLVTCFHVWESYCDEKSKNPDVELVVLLGTGFKARVFTPEFVDGNRDVDLAVFRWDGDFLGEKSFFPVEQFPIPKVDPGGIIALQGFPGTYRQGTETDGKFGACFFGGVATAVNDRKILIENTHSQKLRCVSSDKVMPPVKVGGMSGSPAYTFRDGWRLAGFVIEGSTTDGRLFLSHASFLQPDGRVSI